MSSKAVFVRLAAVILLSALAGCAPTLAMRPGSLVDQLSAAGERFCALQASDPAGAAQIFEPELSARVRAAVAAGENPRLASRVGAGRCAVGRVARKGGSRFLVELRYPGFSDQLDFWAAGQGKARDLIYDGAGGVLSKRLVSAVCRVSSDAHLTAWIGERDLAPGQRAPLRLYWTRQPGQMEPLPDACAPPWRVEGPASLKGGALAVSSRARNGATGRAVTLIQGQEISAAFRIVDPKVAPIARTWRQSSGGCAEEPPVRELVLAGRGAFSLTFKPFESYHDTWGRYDYDAAARGLTLRVEGGNRELSARVLRFEVEGLDAGHLVLVGPGVTTGAARCRMSFAP